jgi:hypothetical protein
MIRIGRGSLAIAGTRAARAGAGRTQANVLAGVAAESNPSVPATNVEETPTVPDAPMTGGDGAVIDEGAADGPFVPDDDSVIGPDTQTGPA